MKRNTLVTLTLLLLSCFFIKAQSFNENDKNVLKSILRQQSAISGKLNLEVLGLSISDTLNWNTSEDWLNKLHQPQGLVYFDWEWDIHLPSQLNRFEIKTFDDSNSQLAGNIDFSGFTKLKYLDCSNGKFTGINVSQNTELKYLDCSNNELTGIEISRLTLLNTLNCSNNKISDLNLINNLNLAHLNCSGNLLTEIELFENYSIVSLICSNNQISRLVLPATPTYLEVLDCSDNLLSSVDTKNSINLKLLSLDNNNFSTLNLQGNINLISFYNQNNLVRNINLTKNNNLLLLNTSDNKLAELKVNGNSFIKYLYAANNEIKDVDFSSNTDLEILDIKQNKLTSLDLSNNSILSELDCSYNDLISIVTSLSSAPLTSLVYNNNHLLFSAMPVSYIVPGVTKELKYSPQNEVDGGEISYNQIIDLSSEYNIKNNNTSYSWVHLTDETASITSLGNGRFSAVENEDKVYLCKLTNPFFPDLTLHYKITIKKDTITDNIEKETISDKSIYYDKESEKIIIEIPKDDVKSLDLYDTLGRNVIHTTVVEGAISTQHLSKGVYVIKLTLISGKYISKKISI